MEENRINNLIASNKIKEAIKELLQLATKLGSEAKEISNSLVLLSSQYHDLKQKSIVSALSIEDKRVLKSQILTGLLELKNDIFELLEHRSLSPESLSNQSDAGLIYDSSEFILYDNKISFGNIGGEFKDYNAQTDFDEEQNTYWKLATKHADELVGLNIFLDILKGVTTFEYFTTQFNETKDNIIFFVIPMKSNASVIEVGADKRADPKNGFSPFRIRKVAKPQINQWQQESIEFDFTDTPDARQSVFALRINEGCPRPGLGEVKIRNIRIYSR